MAIFREFPVLSGEGNCANDNGVDTITFKYFNDGFGGAKDVSGGVHGLFAPGFRFQP